MPLCAHQRGVSAQYVNRRVRVGVGGKSAMLAVERRLALAASFIDNSTTRTRLAGVRRIDLYECSSALLQLVSKQSLDCRPTLVEDGAVQTGFLSHVFARFGGSSNCARGHARYSQILQHNGSKPLGDADRRLMLPVASNAGNLSGQPRRAAPSLRIAHGPAPFSCERTLRFAFASVQYAYIWQGKHLARGQRQRIRDAAVNADRWKAILGRGVFDFAPKGYVPTDPVLGYRSVFRTPIERSRIAKLHPANIWHPYLGPLSIQFPSAHKCEPEAETVIHTSAAWGRILCRTLKESHERSIKVSKRAFKTASRYGRDPIVLASQFCQFPALRRKADVSACLTFELPPEIAALFPRQIIDQANDTADLRKTLRLLWRWRHAVAERSKHSGENLP